MAFRKILFTLLILGCTGQGAHATSFVMTTDAIVSLTMSATEGTSSSFKNDKVVQAAREDAESFVASDGAIRGARLESALLRIRERLRGGEWSDMQLAMAIVAL